VNQSKNEFKKGIKDAEEEPFLLFKNQ